MTALRFGTDTGFGRKLEPRMGSFGYRSIVTTCDILAEAGLAPSGVDAVRR